MPDTELNAELGKMLTLGQAAVELHVLPDQLRRLCDRGEVPHRWFLRKRLVSRDDFAAIRAACVARGYLSPPVAAS